MTTIKITKAITRTNSMCKNSRVVGMTIEFDNVNWDLERDDCKINDYRPMLDGEYRLFLYPNGTIELYPKSRKGKSITITEYETIK